MNTHKLLLSTIEHVVANKHSSEVLDIVDELQQSKNPTSDFCDRFDLGDWFYESLERAKIDVIDELLKVAQHFIREELASSNDAAEIERDLRRAVIG